MNSHKIDPLWISFLILLIYGIYLFAVVALDIHKVFGKVCNTARLNNSNLWSSTLTWHLDFPSNRFITVPLDGHNCSLHAVNFNIPQSPVRVSKSFILLINDLSITFNLILSYANGCSLHAYIQFTNRSFKNYLVFGKLMLQRPNSVFPFFNLVRQTFQDGIRWNISFFLSVFVCQKVRLSFASLQMFHSHESLYP